MIRSAVFAGLLFVLSGLAHGVTLRTESTGRDWTQSSRQERMQFTKRLFQSLDAVGYSPIDLYECIQETYADPVGSPNAYAASVGAIAVICHRIMK